MKRSFLYSWCRSLRGICFVLWVLWPVLLLAQPVNDDFAGAQTLTGRLGSVTTITTGASKELGEPNHGGDEGGASVWYVWEAPASGDAEFDLHGSGFDTTISAYTGSSLATLTAVAQNDDEIEYIPLVSAWLFRGRQSRIRFPAQAGTRYYIAVDGSLAGMGDLSGNVRLNWALKPRPANDNFADAQVITGADGFLTTHNVGATHEAGEPNHATNVGSGSIWYRWTAPLSGATRFHTLSSLTSLPGALDTLLAIYTGDTVGALTPVAANDNAGSNLRSFVQFTATAGTTYQIAVDTKMASTNHGFIHLTWVNGAPANNNFANAEVLGGACGLIQGHNVGANKETGEPAIAGNVGGASIWYSWTAPGNGMAMFTTQGSPFLDTLLAVYTGTSVNGLTLIAANDDIAGGYLDGLIYSRVEFFAMAGTTYKISIDGYKRGTALAETNVTFLHWAFEPASNDNFANAHVLAGASGTRTACNAFTSKETGEPDHAGNPGGHSIWYRWEAPASGLAVIDLAGSVFDTLLAVYKADGPPAVDHLTLVGQNDDLADGFNFAFYSRLKFAATAGTSYYIAVDGRNDGAGYISDGWLVLSYQLYPPPTLQIVRSGQDIVLRWDGPYSVESTPAFSLPGPSVWTRIPGPSPLTLPIGSGGNAYFRATSAP